MGWVKLQDINFLHLQLRVRVECELISENNTPHALPRVSGRAQPSRVLGGVVPARTDRPPYADADWTAWCVNAPHRVLLPCLPRRPRSCAFFFQHGASTRHARSIGRSCSAWTGASALRVVSPVLDMTPAISVIAERGQALTGATGAGVAPARR